MNKGYLVAHLRVHDKEGFEKFRQMAGPTIAEYGGKVLVREPNPDVREGKDSGIALVIEFENIETARKFYDLRTSKNQYPQEKDYISFVSISL